MKKLAFTFATILPLLLLGGCETVEPGNVGVETSWSALTGKVYQPGTHLVGLGVDVHSMSTRLQNVSEDNITCRSIDNVEILVDVTAGVTLNSRSAVKVYSRLGEDYQQTLVVPALRSSVRDVVGHTQALTVAQARAGLENRILENLRAAVRRTLRSRGLPANSVQIDNMQMRQADLPASLRNSIESVQRERNQAAQKEQALVTSRQEAARAQVEAEGRNNVNLINARAQAEVRRIDGESQATFNRTLAASLTPGLIELRRIEAQRAISTNPNAHLVIMGGGNNGGAGPVVLQAPQLSR